MRRFHSFLPALFGGLALATLLIHAASGAPVVFTVNPTLSQITVSGNVEAESVFSAPLTAQDPGSLTASYAGTINAALGNATIQFTGSSLVAAETNAVAQQPAPGGVAGSAPADYGATAQGRILFETVTAHIAVRNLVLDLSSPALSLTNGGFPCGGLEFAFSTNAVGTIDYLDNIGNSGSNALAGTSFDAATASASLTNSGGVDVLTIPVNMTFTETNGTLKGTVLTMVGQLVGEILPPPIIESLSFTNHSAVLAVTNATLRSQIQVSTNLNSWSATPAALTNVSGRIMFTTPVSGTTEFFRVQQ